MVAPGGFAMIKYMTFIKGPPNLDMQMGFRKVQTTLSLAPGATVSKRGPLRRYTKSGPPQMSCSDTYVLTRITAYYDKDPNDPGSLGLKDSRIWYWECTPLPAGQTVGATWSGYPNKGTGST